MPSIPTRRQLLALVASSGFLAGSGCLDAIPGETSTSESTVTDVDCDPAEHSSLSTEIPEDAWSPTRGNQRRTGANLDVEPLGLADVDELQATELFSDSSAELPAVADGTVYVSNGETAAIDVETGETEWSLSLPTLNIETPLVTHDTVYVSASGLQVHAIDREHGEFRWSITLEQDPPRDEGTQTLRTDPLVAKSNVIVGHTWYYGDDEHGWFTALDARCGSERWSFRFEEETPMGIATDGQTIYAASDHHLYALDAEDGTEHWRTRVTDEYLSSDVPPALAGETVILRDQDSLYALSTVDGSERWNTVGGLEVEHPPTVTSDTVYVVESESFNVLALDRETGERRWEYTMETLHEIPAPVTSVPGRVYCLGEFQGFDFRILVLDATTGRKQTEAKLPRGLGTDPVTTPELAVTADGIFTHSHATEGGNPDIIHRFTPK